MDRTAPENQSEATLHLHLLCLCFHQVTNANRHLFSADATSMVVLMTPFSRFSDALKATFQEAALGLASKCLETLRNSCKQQ